MRGHGRNGVYMTQWCVHERGPDVIDGGAGGADGRRDQSAAECVHKVSKTRERTQWCVQERKRCVQDTRGCVDVYVKRGHMRGM